METELKSIERKIVRARALALTLAAVSSTEESFTCADREAIGSVASEIYDRLDEVYAAMQEVYQEVLLTPKAEDRL